MVLLEALSKTHSGRRSSGSSGVATLDVSRDPFAVLARIEADNLLARYSHVACDRPTSYVKQSTKEARSQPTGSMISGSAEMAKIKGTPRSVVLNIGGIEAMARRGYRESARYTIDRSPLNKNENRNTRDLFFFNKKLKNVSCEYDRLND